MVAACDGVYVAMVATTWFHLIGRTNEVYYMYQISCQADELCRSRMGEGSQSDQCSCNFFSLRLLGLSIALFSNLETELNYFGII